MKHFTPAKIIGLVGLLVVATAAGSAAAAPPQGAPAQPAAPQAAPAAPGHEEAPSTCENMPVPSTSDTTSSTASGDPYGPEALVADALSKVCLSDDQRGAVEQLGREVKPKEEAVATARHAFVTTLAEQVRADNFDENALKPKIDDLVKAREDASPVLRKALEDLHGILDPGQRAAFVGALESRMKDIKDGAQGWLDSMAKDLALSDDQKTRIKDVLARSQSNAESDVDRTKGVFDAFKGDQFSIEQIAPESDVGTRTRTRAEAMVDAAREIAGILTEDQRTKLADKIEARTQGNAPGEAPSTGTPPNTAPPNTGMPNTGTGRVEPSTGIPNTGAPGTEDVGTTGQGLFVAGGGYRAGVVRGWGGGFGYGGGFYRGVRTGYVAGYPFAGWGPGIW